MNSIVLSLLMGQTPVEGGPGNPIMTFLPFIAIIAIFYFLIMRPQNKKQKETQKMLSSLRKGDRVTTIGGMHGVIQSVRERTVVIKVDDNVKIEFNRTAIAGVEATRDDKEEEETEAEEKK